MTPIGTPVHPDANFTSALKCLVQVQEQTSGFKLMQTETHLLLPSKVALGLKGIPIALSVPSCPRSNRLEMAAVQVWGVLRMSKLPSLLGQREAD